jgi:hypothetical protein
MGVPLGRGLNLRARADLYRRQFAGPVAVLDTDLTIELLPKDVVEL